jgi:hypothetical protein
MKSQSPDHTDNETDSLKEADRRVRAHGYTEKFSKAFFIGLGLLAVLDLKHAESSRILILTGLSSSGWASFWLLLALLLTWSTAQWASLNLYLIHAVKFQKDVQPVHPGEAGTVDVSFWASLISYTGTLFLAYLLPGGPGWLRRPMIVIVSAIGAVALAAFFIQRLVRAIYGDATLRETISRHQCDMHSIKGGRCQNWALRSRFRGKVNPEEKNFCRWHYISVFTAQQYLPKPSVTRFKQILAAMCLLFGVIGLSNFVTHGGIIWIAVSALAAGACLRYLIESIIAPWHALSRLVIWAKVFAFGLTLELLGGVAFLVVAGLQPQRVLPVVLLFGSGRDWLSLGPLVVYLVIAFIVALGVDALVRRVLLYRMPSFASEVVFAAFLPLWHMLDLGLSQHGLFSRWMSDQFWREVIGSEVRGPLGLALISGFFLSSKILRRRGEAVASTTVAFFATLARLLIPVVLTVISVMASRYALIHLGVVGTVPFVGATVVLSVGVTLLLSRFLRKLVNPA